MDLVAKKRSSTGTILHNVLMTGLTPKKLPNPKLNTTTIETIPTSLPIQIKNRTTEDHTTKHLDGVKNKLGILTANQTT